MPVSFSCPARCASASSTRRRPEGLRTHHPEQLAIFRTCLSLVYELPMIASHSLLQCTSLTARLNAPRHRLASPVESPSCGTRRVGAFPRERSIKSLFITLTEFSLAAFGARWFSSFWSLSSSHSDTITARLGRPGEEQGLTTRIWPRRSTPAFVTGRTFAKAPADWHRPHASLSDRRRLPR